MNIAEVTDIVSSFNSQQKSLFADWNMTVFTYTTSCLGQSLKCMKEEKTQGVEAYISAKTLFILLCDITGTSDGWNDDVPVRSSTSCKTKPGSK